MGFGVVGRLRLGQPKVEQSDLSGRSDLQVVRLDVTMNYLPIVRMQVDDRIEQLVSPSDHGVARKGAGVLRQDGREIIAFDELHHQKRPALFGGERRELRFERGTLRWPVLAWFHLVKLVATPAMAFALTRVLGLPPLESKIAVLMAAVPTAPSAYILAMQMNRTGAPVALIISTGTLIAVVTLPFWIAVAS